MYGEVYHTMGPFVLPQQLLSLGSSIYTLTGRDCLVLTSVFCEHTAWFVLSYTAEESHHTY